MPGPIQIARPPSRPVLVYDGDCRFCAFWILRWKQLTGPGVEYIQSQDQTVANRFPEIPAAAFDQAVQFIQPNGRVYSAAEAVFRALAINPALAWILWLYQNVPGVGPVTELLYRFVARHRVVFSFLTRLLWGVEPELPRFELVRSLFLRALGLIYLFAFGSLWLQVEGLFGRRGILPAAQFMSAAGTYFDRHGVGWGRYHLVPSWCWLSASDASLQLICGGGVFFSLCLMAGIVPALSAAALWSLYLSVSVAGREFMSFQWDVLLLEAGFVAIFFAPLQLRMTWNSQRPVSKIVLTLVRWLVFRLMFESGCVKLLSGDATWLNLTALQYHYETQPLPTWLGWFVHQLPSWFQACSVAILFAIELVLPFFVFGPRRLRLIAWCGLVLLQVWILLTGNYGFFNYLTIVLLVVLLDDAALRRAFPNRLRRWFGLEAVPDSTALKPCDIKQTPIQGPPRAPCWEWPRTFTAALAVLIGFISVAQLSAMFRYHVGWMEPVEAIAGWFAPFRSVNSYGLFAVMTTTRPEIVIEGSNDRVLWLPYEFKFKPGDTSHRPGFVAPHQPRLDWQMWFAALGSYRENPWFLEFCGRLLQGSPDVAKLLKRNPFEHSPPRFVRARLYRYRFTHLSERAQGGQWWKREETGEYLRPISLQDLGLEPP